MRTFPREKAAVSVLSSLGFSQFSGVTTRALPQTVATGSEPVSLTMVAMVHYHVFAEPFVLVVIRGALDKVYKSYNLWLLTTLWLELHVGGHALSPPF